MGIWLGDELGDVGLFVRSPVGFSPRLHVDKWGSGVGADLPYRDAALALGNVGVVIILLSF